MTNEEAIERIHDHMVVHKMAEKRAIKITKALQMAMDALKKRQPKKVVYDINGLTGLPVSFCPSCGEGVNMYAYGRNDLKQVFCPYCGQALDWKDGEQK